MSSLFITELNLEERSALLPVCWTHSGMRGALLGSEVFFRVDVQWIKNTYVLKLSFNRLFAKCDKLCLHHLKITLWNGERRIKVLNPALQYLVLKIARRKGKIKLVIRKFK